ncbi:MAG: hypothetical protein ACR2KV_16455 [Solirubrobacteraceae bacterium]
MFAPCRGGPTSGRRLRLAAAGAFGIALAGCGSGDRPTRYPVFVPTASFAARQQIATPQTLRIVVRNDGDRALPEVAVAIDSFTAAATGTDPQNSPGPVWIVDRGPGGGGAAFGGATETWTRGSLAPGATQTFRWRVTPVRPGRYSVRWQVAAGTAGRTVAELADGRPAAGAFAVMVSAAPAHTRVDPATGRVVARPLSGAGAAG